MSSCFEPTTSTAVAPWKPPLFAFGPTPPADRKLVVASRRLERLRAKNGTYSWWQNLDAVFELLRQLEENNFAVIDGFAGSRSAHEMRDAVISALAGDVNRGGSAQSGRVGSSEGSGSSASALRSDRSMWARPGATLAPAIERYVRRADNLIAALRGTCRGDGHDAPPTAPEDAAQRARLALQRTTHRSDAMLAIYPRGGAKYVRHTDNVCDPVGVGSRCNGRRLTAVYYLNAPEEEQQQQHDQEQRQHRQQVLDSQTPAPRNSFASGALRLFETGAIDSEPRVDVEPLMDRLVLFWSDARVPHAVLPTGPRADRYATTLWYFDEEELSRANERLQRGGSSVTQEVRRVFE